MGGMLISDMLKQQGTIKGYGENQPEEESAIQKETDNVVNGLLSAAMSGAFQPEQQIVESPQVNAMQGVGSTDSGPFQRLPENLSWQEYYNMLNSPTTMNGLFNGNPLWKMMNYGAAKYLAGEGNPDFRISTSVPGWTPRDALSFMVYGTQPNQPKPEWERYFQNFPEERAKYPVDPTKSLI